MNNNNNYSLLNDKAISSAFLPNFHNLPLQSIQPFQLVPHSLQKSINSFEPYHYKRLNYYIDFSLGFLFIMIMTITTITNPMFFSKKVSLIINFYEQLRTTGINYQCNVGGSSIQTAECQIIQGLNIMITYTVSGLMEYTSSIFHSKNIWEMITKLITVVCISQVVLWNLFKYILFGFQFIHHQLHRIIFHIVYYWYDFNTLESNAISANLQNLVSNENSSNKQYGFNNTTHKLVTPTKKEIHNYMQMYESKN